MVDHNEEETSWEEVRGGRTVLKRGQTGELVRLLQEKLSATGYEVEPTGIFGPSTEFAVMDLQKNNQITRTGQVGARTSVVLDSMWENTWDQVAQGYVNLSLGDQNPAISELQERLTVAGFTVDPSGVFGPTTRRRVMSFQKKWGLEPTGVVDKTTAIALGAIEDEETDTSPTLRESELVRVHNVLVTQPVADAFTRMARAAQGDGVVVRALEGYRDETRQKTVAREAGFVATSACTGNPGQNIHGTGTSLDLDDGCSYRWLRRNAVLFGFAMPQPSEPWHWIYDR